MICTLVVASIVVISGKLSFLLRGYQPELTGRIMRANMGQKKPEKVESKSGRKVDKRVFFLFLP